MDDLNDPSPGDLKLWERALRNDWPIPPAVKRRLLQVAVDLADPAVPEEDPERAARRDRVRLGALRVLAAFARTNTDQARVDLARERFEDAKARRLLDLDGPSEAETLREYLERPEDAGPEGGPGVRGDGA